jgi:hypothetical protein
MSLPEKGVIERMNESVLFSQRGEREFICLLPGSAMDDKVGIQSMMMSRALADVVSGTTTVTGIFNARPA